MPLKKTENEPEKDRFWWIRWLSD